MMGPLNTLAGHLNIVIWLIVIGALLIAFGPILYLRPSARDRRLTALRAHARKLGLIVDIEHLDKLNASAEERVNSGGKQLDPKIEIARYRQSFRRKLRHITPLLIQRDAAGKRPFVGFRLTGDAFQDAAIYDCLAEVLAAMPADAEALDVDARFLSCYWREGRTDDQIRLAAMAELLASAAAELVAIDESLDQALDTDSDPDDEPDKPDA